MQLLFIMFIKDTINQILNRSLIVFFNQLSIIIIIPIIANRFDLITFGYIAKTMIFIQLGWLFSNFGLINRAIEEIPNIQKKKYLDFFVSRALLQIFYLCLIYISGLYLLIKYNILYIPSEIFISAIPAIIFGSYSCLWFFQSKKNPKALVKITFFSRLFFLVTTYFYIYEINNFYFFTIQAISLFLISSYSIKLMITKYNISLKYVPIYKIIKGIKDQFPFFINLIVNSQINILWAFSVSVSMSPYFISLYYIGDQIFRSAGIFSNIISQVFRVNTINKKENESEKYLFYLVIMYIFLGFLLSILVYLFYKYFLPEDFYHGLFLSILMILAWVIQSILKLFNYPILGFLYGYKLINKIALQFFILHLSLVLIWSLLFKSVFLIPIFLIFGFSLNLIYYLYMAKIVNSK